MRTVTREPTERIDCPHCAGVVRYYAYSDAGALSPHFYCDRCSNVVWRARDHAFLRGREAPTPGLLRKIASDLPVCPCGGRFRPGTNPKCPHCERELAHQRTPEDRLFDAYVIQLEGAALFLDDDPPATSADAPPIDPETGAVRTDEVTITSTLTLDEVRAWPAFESSSVRNERDGWADAVLRRQLIGGAPFDVWLMFQHGRIASVSLAHADPRFGTSWDDWTEEKQKELQRWHDDWLRDVAGVHRESYRWGRIGSWYDSKGGFSSIGLHYGPPRK